LFVPFACGVCAAGGLVYWNLSQAWPAGCWEKTATALWFIVCLYVAIAVLAKLVYTSMLHNELEGLTSKRDSSARWK